MSDKLKYIDDLAKEKLSDFKLKSGSSWNDFSEKNLSANSTVSAQFSSKILSFFINKYILITFVAGIIGIVAYFWNFAGDEQKNEDIKVNKPEISETKAIDTENSIPQIINDTTDDSVLTENDTNLVDKNEQDEKIVTEPVHENVIVKKTIYVRDTLRHTDTIKVYKSAIDSILQSKEQNKGEK